MMHRTEMTVRRVKRLRISFLVWVATAAFPEPPFSAIERWASNCLLAKVFGVERSTFLRLAYLAHDVLANRR